MGRYITYNVQRYATAKKLLLNAMRKNQSIYLQGTGGNGKTHLIQEVMDEITKYKYRFFNNNNGPSCLLRRSIICVFHPEEITHTELDNAIIINMNKLYYGKFKTDID